MYGKKCIVTGSNSGIGKETARGLAALGADVFLVVRNEKKGEDAKKEIISSTGNENVQVMVCDLSSQESIKEFATQYRKKHKRLDVLVNNAGIITAERVLSPEGIEMTFAVNHLGYFLLTHQLLDVILKTSSSRIVNVASCAQSSINLDDVQNERKFSGRNVYAQSKLANIMFTYELAAKLPKNTTVNCLHPGVVNTHLFRNHPLFSGVLHPVFDVAKNFFKSPLQGARNSIYLASSSEVSGVSGKYFVGIKPSISHCQSYDAGARKRLWEISEELTGVKYGI
ncbi:MAG: SDR family oxidoreductase [Candidatus Altiarchaeota archaeon]|nr:SDR family oxidoreductase [Candidatus Altiarchaeota archaeon]